MEKIDKYIESIEKQIDDWHKEILKFRVIAEVADKDAQVEHYKIIDEITDLQSEVVAKLKVIKGKSLENWEALADEIQNARKQVNDAIEAARIKIN